MKSLARNFARQATSTTKSRIGRCRECESKHNLKYWRREPYIGFGAGAHSFDGAQRWANVHDPARYVACIEQGISPREQIESVTPDQALDEEFFLGLRQLDGVDMAQNRPRIRRQSERTRRDVTITNRELVLTGPDGNRGRTRAIRAREFIDFK